MPVILCDESEEQSQLDRSFKYFLLPLLCITVCFAIWMIFLALNAIPKASSIDTIEAGLRDPNDRDKNAAALKALNELREQNK